MSKIPLREKVVGFGFIGTLLAVLIWLVAGSSIRDWWNKPTPPAATTQTQEAIRVTGSVEHEGARYLVWSNGVVTPDMADHRKFMVRAMAAQAILAAQKEAER